MSPAAAGALVLLLLGAAACQRPLKPAERGDVLSWLECEECVDGELSRVIHLGHGWRTGAATSDSLIDDLLAGPGTGRTANISQQFLAAFHDDSVASSTAGGGFPVGSPQYIRHYVGNYVAVYRGRAAIALARIGGKRARAALDSARAGHLRQPTDSLRPDVLDEVAFGLDSILGP